MNRADPIETATATATTRPWWKGAAIYQIYPRSFQDSNGDGFLTQRLTLSFATVTRILGGATAGQ